MANFKIQIDRPVIDQQTPDGLFTGIRVRVCDGHGVPKTEDFVGLHLGKSLRMREKYDPEAINHLRQPGAFRVDVDVAAVAQAIAELTAHWGNIPVLDYSGACGNLVRG